MWEDRGIGRAFWMTFGDPAGAGWLADRIDTDREEIDVMLMLDHVGLVFKPRGVAGW
jgi:hypothetical protein